MEARTNIMKLTAKQERFAQCIADGMTQADAYRNSFSAGKMTDKQIWEEASKVASNPKVAQRVTDLKAALEAKALWSREKSVQALANIADSGDAKPTEIVAAIKELNAMHGFNAPTKIEMTVKTLAEELAALNAK
jgi:hypothetical protein